MVYKIRITSPNAEAAEELRQCLQVIFGDAIKVPKARQGSNPKYAGNPDVLAYATLTLSADDITALIDHRSRRPVSAPVRKQR
jgi:hypothetical protein